MALKADIYQLGRSRRWRWCVYDTDLPLRSLAGGSAEAHEWERALNAARESLRVQAFIARVDDIVKALAWGTTIHRHTTGLPPAPPALVWEGDYA